MDFPWEVFPLMMQAVYVAASIPPLLRLVKLKRSDQRALADHWLALGAHGGMLVWAHAYAQEPGMVASVLVACATTLVSAALIRRYRQWPGGKPDSVARAPSRLHPSRAQPHVLAVV